MNPIRLKSGRVVTFTQITEGEFAGAFRASCDGSPGLGELTDAEWVELDRILAAAHRRAA